jgi:hypothetical protein
MDERFPDVACPRCQTWAQLYTVPLRLVSAGGTAWQALCDEYFRRELKVERNDLLMRPHSARQSSPAVRSCRSTARVGE